MEEKEVDCRELLCELARMRSKLIAPGLCEGWIGGLISGLVSSCLALKHNLIENKMFKKRLVRRSRLYGCSRLQKEGPPFSFVTLIRYLSRWELT